MTRFLASISNTDEASLLLAAGADIIDIKDPHKGALGAVEHAVIRDIVQKISGRVLTSATIGDLPMQTEVISAAIDAMRKTGVDIIKVGIFASSVPARILDMIRQHTCNDCQVVLVFFADMQPYIQNFSTLAETGIYGVMLDTADKTRGSLRSHLNDQALNEFVSSGRASGLLTGLAGSLKLTDIPSLLKVRPDYLGFRSALCDRQQRQGVIDASAVHNVRAMIPVNHSYTYNNNLIANV